MKRSAIVGGWGAKLLGSGKVGLSMGEKADADREMVETRSCSEIAEKTRRTNPSQPLGQGGCSDLFRL